MLSWILKLVFPLSIELIIFIIAKSFSDDAQNDQVKQSLNDIKDIVPKILKIESSVENINSIVPNINTTTAKVLVKRDEFYTCLKECREKAKSKVWLMHLDPIAPFEFGEGVRKDYFDSTIQYARDNPNIEIRRILSIPSIQKLEWALMCVNDSKDLNNLHFAYLRIDDIASTVPTPPIISVQIIDDTEMLYLDPRYSYMPQRYYPCVYLNNHEVVKLFSAYYTSLWDRIENCKDPGYGCILKNGFDYNGISEKTESILVNIGLSAAEIDMEMNRLFKN